MSINTFPVSGSFGGRRSQPLRRTAEPQSTARVQSAPVATKRSGWLNFANHYATWATAGRLPLSE